MYTRKQFIAVGAGMGTLLSGWFSPSLLKAEDVKLDEAVKKATGKSMAEIKEDNRVSVIAPTIAESGANVPVKTELNMDINLVKSIYVFVDNNPAPLALGTQVTPEMGKISIEARLRFAKSSGVRSIAILKDGTAIMGMKKVKVTVGGCG